MTLDKCKYTDLALEIVMSERFMFNWAKTASAAATNSMGQNGSGKYAYSR